MRKLITITLSAREISTSVPAYREAVAKLAELFKHDRGIIKIEDLHILVKYDATNINEPFSSLPYTADPRISVKNTMEIPKSLLNLFATTFKATHHSPEQVSDNVSRVGNLF